MTVSGATSACSRQDPNWDERVRRLATAAKRGDGDPLDICVQSERAIARSEIIVRGRVIGGLQMIDGGEADDKIVSVLENDYVWGGGSQRERGASGAGGATSALLFDVQARAGPARAGTHCQGVWTGSSVFETSPFVLAADLLGSAGVTHSLRRCSMPSMARAPSSR